MTDRALTNEQMYTILSQCPWLDNIEAFLPEEIKGRMVAFQRRVCNAYASIEPEPTVGEAQDVFGEAFLALAHAPDARSKLRLIMDMIGLNPSAPDRGNGGRGHAA